MKVVDENTVLEVGKFYWVRCAVIKNTFKTLYVPVIGNLHKDAQFGINHNHYHIDGRFIGKGNAYRDCVDDNGKTNCILYTQDVTGYTHQDIVTDVIVKRRKCKRLTTGVKPPPTAYKYWAWYETMIGKSCKGKKCPHLGTAMHERDGKWICPLHNLVGCPETEKIIPCH